MSTAPPLSGYHHLGITVSDVEASEAWYGETLGLVRAFVEPHAGTNPDNGGFAVVMTRPGTGFFIGLDHHPEAEKLPFDPRRTGLDHVALAASSAQDVHAWAAHLDVIGVEHGPVIEGNEPMPMALVALVDPDGVPIEVIWVGH